MGLEFLRHNYRENINKKFIIVLNHNIVFSKNLYVEEESNKITRSNQHI